MAKKQQAGSRKTRKGLPKRTGKRKTNGRLERNMARRTRTKAARRDQVKTAEARNRELRAIGNLTPWEEACALRGHPIHQLVGRST